MRERNKLRQAKNGNKQTIPFPFETAIDSKTLRIKLFGTIKNTIYSN